ncbi:hypothetical protein M378DRAFT_164821, partial [Amanita muscaria Koide BX008]
MLFSLTLHGKTCGIKQKERQKQIADFYHKSITDANKSFLNKPIKELAETVQAKSSSDSR